MIGKNLSIDNSFTLKFVNLTSTPFTFNLFNQGSIGQNAQTALTTGTIAISQAVFVAELTNGVFIVPSTFAVLDINNNLLVSQPMLAAQTLANLTTLVNPITDVNGNVGDLYIQQTVGDLTGKLYDISITLPDIAKVAFSPSPSFEVSGQTLSYVSGNPFLNIQGVVPVTVIQQSETGNAYRIMGVDIISTNSEQLLEDIFYGNREPNGNIWSASFTPTIDPYQGNAIAIHAVGGRANGVPMDDFTINTDTTFSYTILSNSFSRLTFNYVKASLGLMREFNQALASELSMRFVEQKNYLDSLKGGTIFLQ